MANVIKIKQSAVPGKAPTTAQLELGELAINTVDGKLFLKKNVSGAESIVDVTAAASGEPQPLVSGVDIKTINGQSLLGPGNLVISGEGGGTTGGITTGKSIAMAIVFGF